MPSDGCEFAFSSRVSPKALTIKIPYTSWNYQDMNHRIRFMYTPKHTSWLNQIELWFSMLGRRLLRRGNFTSVEDLRERILAFIAYFNKAMAKPFKWTYKGRPLTV